MKPCRQGVARPLFIKHSRQSFLLPLLVMALASVLERPLPVNRSGFFGLGGRADLLDLGPGSPNDGLSLAAPGWGVPDEPRIEMLHGTTTLAFKVRTPRPRWVLRAGAPRGPRSCSGRGWRWGVCSWWNPARKARH